MIYISTLPCIHPTNINAKWSIYRHHILVRQMTFEDADGIKHLRKQVLEAKYFVYIIKTHFEMHLQDNEEKQRSEIDSHMDSESGLYHLVQYIICFVYFFN